MRTPTRLALCLSLLPIGAPAVAQLAPIGLSEVRAQWFDNETFGFYHPDPGDRFGAAVATGDFNGDGAADLATGIPDDEDIHTGLENAGRVVVRWGVPGRGLAGGLATTVLHQALAASPDPPESGDRFGAALAAGDFNGDGFADLAVGAP